MKRKFRRQCLKCFSPLSKRTKGNYCIKCRDITGENNPFYGKTHSAKTIEIIKNKTKISSTKLWTQEEYRNKVIKGVSKPRRDSFKNEQSIRITDWYKNHPEQKDLRSKIMKESWANGLIPLSSNKSFNKSNKEIQFFNLLKKQFPNNTIQTDATLRIEKTWFYPDAIIDNIAIIEYMGDYFHANPDFYDKTYYFDRLKKTAEEIWLHDINRKHILSDSKYPVLFVWENEVDSDINNVFSNVETFLLEANWEYCS